MSFTSVLSAESRTKIAELCEAFKKDQNGVKIIQMKLQKILQDDGHAQRRLFRCKQIGVHPANRDKKKITATGMHDRAERMHGIGFVKSVFEAETFAFEDNPFTKAIAKSSIDHFATDARFAIYQQHEILGGSVGGSHTNHMCAATADERPCSTPGISKDGKIDKMKLYQNPEYKDACEGESYWWFIRWEIEAEFPVIPTIYQGALNATQHVGTGAHDSFYNRQFQFPILNIRTRPDNRKPPEGDRKSYNTLYGIYMHTCVYIYIYTHICVCIYTCNIYIYVHMYMCMCPACSHYVLIGA